MLYPRLIDVHRVKTVAGLNDAIGGVGYSGATASTASGAQGETILFTGLPANIQAGAAGRKRDGGTPQDVVSNPTWMIYLPLTAIAKGLIRDRDVLVDDEQYRYEVGQAYWNLLGWKLMCIRLEA